MALPFNPLQLFGIGAGGLGQATGNMGLNRQQQARLAQRERLTRFQAEREKRNLRTKIRAQRQMAREQVGLNTAGALAGGAALGLGQKAAQGLGGGGGLDLGGISDPTGLPGSPFEGPPTEAASDAFFNPFNKTSGSGIPFDTSKLSVDDFKIDPSASAMVNPASTSPGGGGGGSPFAGGGGGGSLQAQASPQLAMGGPFGGGGLGGTGLPPAGNGIMGINPFASLTNTGIAQLGDKTGMSPELTAALQGGITPMVAGHTGGGSAPTFTQGQFDEQQALQRQLNGQQEQLPFGDAPSSGGGGLAPTSLPSLLASLATGSALGAATAGGDETPVATVDAAPTTNRIPTPTTDPATEFIKRSMQQRPASRQSPAAIDPNQDQFPFGSTRTNSVLRGMLLGLGSGLSGQDFIGKGLDQFNADRRFRRGLSNDEFEKFDADRKFERQVDNDYYNKGAGAFSRAFREGQEEFDQVDANRRHQNELKRIGISEGNLGVSQDRLEIAKRAEQMDNLARGTDFIRSLFGGGSEPKEDPAAFRTLQRRAEEAGLEPGTPEYERFMAEGGFSKTVTFDGLHRRALAAGLTPDSEPYRQFMLSNGKDMNNPEVQQERNDSVAEVIDLALNARRLVDPTGEGDIEGANNLWGKEANALAKQALSLVKKGSSDYKAILNLLRSKGYDGTDQVKRFEDAEGL